MKYLTFSWWDYILFILMMTCSAIIGIYYGFFDKNRYKSTNYLYGGNKMKVLPVSISLIASSVGVTDILAIPAEIYMHGTQYWVMVFSIPAMGLIIHFLYLPVICKLKLSSVYEYFQLRFHKRVRYATSLVFIIPSLFYVPLMIYAPSLAFSQVTGFDVHIIMPTVALICIFYTTVGGLKAVIWADNLQFCVTFCTLCFTLIMGVISMGGFSYIWNKAKVGDRIQVFEMNPDPTIRATFWGVFLGQTFYWIAFAAIHPASMQRFVSVPTLKDSKRVLIIFSIGTIINRTIMCFCGLIMYAKYFDCDPFTAGLIKNPDQIVPYYVLDVASHIPGLSALFIAGLFSMDFSVLSTTLNVLACTIYADLVVPFIPEASRRMADNITKGITVGVGVLGICLAFITEKVGSIFEATFIITAITVGPLVGVLTLGLLCPIANTKGALFGGIGSTALMMLIVIKTNIHIWNGAIKHESKPLYTSGCNITNITSSLNETFFNTTSIPDNIPENPFWLFKISFHYHFLIGFLAVLVIGGAVSWITKNSNDVLVDPNLLSPPCRRFNLNATRNPRYESVKCVLNAGVRDKE